MLINEFAVVNGVAVAGTIVATDPTDPGPIGASVFGSFLLLQKGKKWKGNTRGKSTTVTEED